MVGGAPWHHAGMTTRWWIPLVMLGCLILGLTGLLAHQPRRAARELDARLLVQAEALPPPPESVRISQASTTEPTFAAHSITYHTLLPFDRLAPDYDGVAQHAGWSFQQEVTMLDGVRREYCKGEFQFALLRHPSYDPSGWQFVTAFSVGSTDRFCP
jgi:hypothetical protein